MAHYRAQLLRLINGPQPPAGAGSGKSIGPGQQAAAVKVELSRRQLMAAARGDEEAPNPTAEQAAQVRPALFPVIAIAAALRGLPFLTGCIKVVHKFARLNTKPCRSFRISSVYNKVLPRQALAAALAVSPATGAELLSLRRANAAADWWARHVLRKTFVEHRSLAMPLIAFARVYQFQLVWFYVLCVWVSGTGRAGLQRAWVRGQGHRRLSDTITPSGRV